MISPISGDSISSFCRAPTASHESRSGLRRISRMHVERSIIPKLIFDPFTASSTRRAERIVTAPRWPRCPHRRLRGSISVNNRSFAAK